MESAQFIFTSEPIEIKSEGENFFVEGYISTSDLDLVNDIVTKGCLLDMAEQMKTRSIKFDVEHESFRGKTNLERETNKTIIPVGKVDDFLIDKKGIKVRAMLNKNSHRFDEVKGSIQDGFLDAFSIAYVPMKSTQVTKNGQQVRMLDKINLLNVAFTGNPVNTEAKMTKVFAKSLEFLEEQEKACDKKPDKKEEMDEEDENKKKKKEEKNHSQSNDIIKLQEAKKMSEENEKVENQKSNEPAQAPASEPAKETEEKDKELAEVKSKLDAAEKELAETKSSLEATNKEVAELKAALKKPVMKSKVEQQDKSDNFVEKKSQNPLDLIA